MSDHSHQGETDVSDFSEVWVMASNYLQDAIGTDKFRDWIYPLIPSFDPDKNKLFLESPSQFFKAYVETTFLGLLQTAVWDACLRLGLQTFEVALTSGDNVSLDPARPDDWQDYVCPEPQLQGFREKKTASLQPFNPWFTFENFVVGESNEMAYECFHAFSKDRQLGNNLLFAYSDTGLGKSHLAQAAGSEVFRQNKNVSYFSARDYSNHYVDSIKQKDFKSFNVDYKKSDFMVVEDVTFFSKKPQFQNEICGVMDFMLNKGAKVVFTSDQLPSEIPYISPAFRSRMSAALMAPIKPPTYETRLRILNNLVKAYFISMPTSVLELVAQNVTSDVRRLGSCLTSIQAKSEYEKKPVSLALAKDVLAFATKSPSDGAAIAKIKNLICEVYRLEESVLTSHQNAASLARTRAIAIYLCKHMTSHSFSEIGRAFNRRHSTIMYNFNKISMGLKKDDALRNTVDYLIGQLGKLI
ncbi:MAG: hypothetical protein LBF38_12135 [Deltaproteobacteria bacterium]|jgi:chromosomal replication initiator protein|nr:hypothetical protein [Deltaproteobacteria bacterium]